MFQGLTEYFNFAAVPPKRPAGAVHPWNAHGGNSHLPQRSMKFDEDDTPVTSPDVLKIVIVLDESGSMQPEKERMIKAVNSFIKEQKQVEGKDATFTFVKFNGKAKRVIVNTPFKNAKLLTSEDYNPNGSTALYDTIGSTINWFRNEKDVLMVIVTDGEDTASGIYSKSKIADMIEEKKRKMNWSYVYLSCDLDTFKQGQGIGMYEDAYTSNKMMKQEKLGAYMSTNLNTACTNYRKNGISVQSQLNSS